MKKTFSVLAASLIATSALAAPLNVNPQACWLETSAAPMPAAMGGEGIRDRKVWNSTISAVLVRHPKGDVLIDAGFSPDAEAQMNELPTAARAFGLQIVSDAKNRRSILRALGSVGENPARVARILITHAHYDHLGGATQLTAPIFVASAEAAWMTSQAANPTITPPSLVAAVK